MLIQQIIPEWNWENKCYYEMNPIGICIHNTANDAPAKNEISYMSNNTNEVSFHIAIDDIESIQAILFNRNSWHAGDGGSGEGNRKYISIEICYSKSGGERFIKAEQRAAKEVANLLKQFGWTINNIKKHQDFSGKYCPHRTLDMGWQRFLNMIQSELNGSSTNTPATSDLYRVRKSWGDASTQRGAYSNLNNAKSECDKHPWYSVYDRNGIRVYPTASVTPTPPATSSKRYLNLHPHNSSWRVYKIGVGPVVGNECGSLTPAYYGGLSYEIIEDKGNIKIINTATFGKVQIYAPSDNDSSITASPIY